MHILNILIIFFYILIITIEIIAIKEKNTSNHFEIDSFVIEADKLDYQNGKNLIYITFGNNEFHRDILYHLKTFLFEQIPNILCLHLNEINSTDFIRQNILDFSRNYPLKHKLIILHGTESLIDEKLKYLNILFRITDSHFEISNIVIVLTWDLLIQNISTSSNSWKAEITKRFNSDAFYVNGAALAGRINNGFSMRNANYSFLMNAADNILFCDSISFPRQNVLQDVRDYFIPILYKITDLISYMSKKVTVHDTFIVLIISISLFILYYVLLNKWKMYFQKPKIKKRRTYTRSTQTDPKYFASQESTREMMLTRSQRKLRKENKE